MSSQGATNKTRVANDDAYWVASGAGDGQSTIASGENDITKARPSGLSGGCVHPSAYICLGTAGDIAFVDRDGNDVLRPAPLNVEIPIGQKYRGFTGSTTTADGILFLYNG